MNRKWARVNYQPGVGLGENGARVTADKEHITLSKDACQGRHGIVKKRAACTAITDRS